jgi:nitrogen fixation NifU-like protein
MAGDPECGDYLKIFLKVEDDFITDIKFQVHGCAGAISSSSMTTEMAKGLPIMAAFAITEHDIVNKLGGLPEEKIHCSLLGAMALKKAIVDYAQNRKK